MKPVTPVLHTMFGVSVNYVDWIDFVINCLELPCPNADDLLELKHKYTILERAKRNNHDQNCIEGIYCLGVECLGYTLIFCTPQVA